MLRRKSRTIIEFIVAMVFIASLLPGCSLLGTSLNKDEQARVVLGGMQTALPVLKTAGDAYTLAQPQYANQWNTVAVPGFISFNQFLGGLEQKGKDGQVIDISTVIVEAQPQILNIVNMISSWGAISSSVGSKPTPEQIALIISVSLAQGTLLVDTVQGYMGGTIPSWEVILAQNAIFQNQLTGGKSTIKMIKKLKKK